MNLLRNFSHKLADIKSKLKLYNMSSLMDTYLAGGGEYMHHLTLRSLFNIGVIGYIIFCRINKKEFRAGWIEVIKHVSGLAVAYGTFGTLFGLFIAFGVLETSEQIIPFRVIMGGLKVAL